MKKRLLFVIVLSALITAGRAQLVVIKPAAGINFTKMGKYQYENRYQTKTGFQAGASAAIGRRFYVEPGLYYVRKNVGYYIVEPFIDGPALAGTYHLFGLHVPLSIGYHIVGGNSPKDLWGLRVFTGGSAFLLGKTDQTAGFNRTQWGLLGGLGIDFAYLFLDAKYEWSLTDVQKEISTYDIRRSKSVYLNLGIQIPVSK